MCWSSFFVQFYCWIATLISLAVSGSIWGQECPRDYLEGPSRKCSDSLHAVLDEIQTSDQLISAELRLNKTCREWDRANACYQQLMLRCSQDPVAIQHLRLHIGKYIIYSVPCSRRNTITIMPNHSLGDCIVSEISTIHTCTDAIETYLKHFITNRNFRGACRVVSSVFRCLHDMRGMVEARCGQEGSLEYTRHFVRPIVEQTRNVVINHCSLQSPYSDYFVPTPLTSGSVTASHNFFLLLLACITILNLSSSCRIRIKLFTPSLPKRASTLLKLFRLQSFVNSFEIFLLPPTKIQSFLIFIVRNLTATLQMYRSCLQIILVPLKTSISEMFQSATDYSQSQASTPSELLSTIPQVAHFSRKKENPARRKKGGKGRRFLGHSISNFKQTACFHSITLLGKLSKICLNHRYHPRRRYHHLRHRYHHLYHRYDLRHHKRHPTTSSCLSKSESKQYSSHVSFSGSHVIPFFSDSNHRWDAQISKQTFPGLKASTFPRQNVASAMHERTHE